MRAHGGERGGKDEAVDLVVTAQPSGSRTLEQSRLASRRSDARCNRLEEHDRVLSVRQLSANRSKARRAARSGTAPCQRRRPFKPSARPRFWRLADALPSPEDHAVTTGIRDTRERLDESPRLLSWPRRPTPTGECRVVRRRASDALRHEREKAQRRPRVGNEANSIGENIALEEVVHLQARHGRDRERPPASDGANTAHDRELTSGQRGRAG